MTKERRILVISAGVVHPTLSGRKNLKKIIDNASDLNAEYTSNVESLVDLNSGEYSAVVLFFHRKKISQNALSALDKFVSNGGGLLAVHSTTASFKSENDYFKILGGRFIHHDKIREFTVSQTNKKSGIFRDLDDFKVRDELYIHECEDDIDVHFEVKNGDSSEPVVWTRSYGKGRVCYSMFGHIGDVLKLAEVISIMNYGLKWVVE